MSRWIVSLLLTIVVNAAALWLGARIVSGITFHGTLVDLLVLAVIFGAINTFVKPVIQTLALPFHLVTLGLTLIVVNALLLGLTALLSPAYDIDGLFPAILGAFVIGLLTLILTGLTGLILRDR